MAFIYSSLTVANIATAKALNASTTPKRVDGLFLAIADTGTGFPGWYRYSAASVLAESLPSVFRPTDNVGAWLQFSGGDGGGSAPLAIINPTNGATYDVDAGDRVLFAPDYFTETIDATLRLPLSPQPGDEIEILVYYPYYDSGFFQFTLSINTRGQPFIGQFPTNLRLSSTSATPLRAKFLGAKIAYVDNNFGWYPLPPALAESFNVDLG